MELANIYSQFHQALLGFIKSKVNNHHDAEDILQNVFLKIATGINDLSRSEKLQSWIYTIARNSITDYYRKADYRTTIASTDDVPDVFALEEYNDATKGLDCCLLNFMHQLPEEYKDIIIDVEMHGVKQKDLAAKYNLAYPSIRSRVQRGREKFKELLLACCTIESDTRGNILDVVAHPACMNNESGSCKN